MRTQPALRLYDRKLGAAHTIRLVRRVICTVSSVIVMTLEHAKLILVDDLGELGLERRRHLLSR